ncbi:acetyltransferase [Pseudarthrobacter sp. R1]|uniref:GNAT family N-acetyltransferase n=1 Tax=Pseudarthrobacter sp. R1 TaxID=2944934 RepID=UPI0021087EE9|nr:GNAT family N-acetyltransferase [Pseudarthrobacter sp. R1]MCQ6272945.1 acetyltransferase [Pseudarthrobacter sp. R1]
MTGADTALPLAARSAVFEEQLAGLGRLRLVVIAPEADADLIYSWVREERAQFWGMGAMTRDEVRDIYLFLDSLDTHHGFVMVVEDQPVGIFQTYEPLHDPVGEAYPARPEDTGMHLLLAPAAQPVPHFTATLLSGLIRFLLTDPSKDRVVAEPDARNRKAIGRLVGYGFEPGPRVQLAEKEAQLVFLTREKFESRPAG